MERQKAPKDNIMLERVKEKVNGVRMKGYIDKGLVRSVTGYFAVPKGSDNIRMVYDATKCGLNDAL